MNKETTISVTSASSSIGLPSNKDDTNVSFEINYLNFCHFVSESVFGTNY